ncbi:MAG: hypothetical protein ACLVCY_20560, partial [Bacteroides fragilis]
DDCPCTPGIKFIAHLPIWAQELGYTQRFRLHSQSANGICHFHAVDTVFSAFRQQFSFRRVHSSLMKHLLKVSLQYWVSI